MDEQDKPEKILTPDEMKNIKWWESDDHKTWQRLAGIKNYNYLESYLH